MSVSYNKLTPTTAHEAVVFGYGSLADPESRAQQVTGNNWEFGNLNHFRRKFNAGGGVNSAANWKHFPTHETRGDIIPLLPSFNPVYLNATPEMNHQLYGVYFSVTPLELRKIKEREANYVLVDVTGFVPKEINLKGKPCYMAMAKSDSTIRAMYETARIASPYWDMCVAAHESTPELKQSWERDAAFPDFAMERIDVALPYYLEKY